MTITGSEIGSVSILKGNKVNLPVLADGVFAVTEDTKELFVGTSAGNLMVYSQPSYVVATPTSNQSLSTLNAWNKVNFDTELTDTLGEYNPVTSKFTASKSGRYLVIAALNFSDATTRSTALAVYVNGVIAAKIFSGQVGTVTAEQAAGSIILTLNATDYMEIYCYIYTASTSLTGATVSYLEIVRIGV